MKKTKTLFVFLGLILVICIETGAQIKINNGAYLTIDSGAYLLTDGDIIINNDGKISLRGAATVSGTLTNNAGITGLVVESDTSGTGSLIENSGINATIERFINQGRYHYISSPVSEQDISLLQSGTAHTDYDLFWYDESYKNGIGPAWLDASSQVGEMEVGLGYTYSYNTSNRTLAFEGTTNQGFITEPVTYTYDGGISTSDWYFGWNLIGNPYPSRLNATSFIDDANNAAIYGTIYFWDENAGYSSGRNDYGVWNKTGAISGGGGNTPNGCIDVGQSFFVHYGSGTGQTSGNVAFKNSMRVHDKAVFFKNSENLRIKIGLHNEEGDYNETLLGFIPGCSEGFDNQYDGFKLKGNAQIALYTNLVDNDGYDYAIQALPPLNAEGTTVKLGMNASQEGFYTLSIVSKDNMNDTLSVYLEDTYRKIFTNLQSTPEYHFSIEEAGEYNDRFNLHFNNYGLGLEEQDFENGYHVYSYNNHIIIENNNKENETIAMIYDTGGKLVLSKKLNNWQRTEIKLNASRGIYFFRIMGSRQVFTGKIFVP